MKGIEPSYSAWKAAALPLSYTRAQANDLSCHCMSLNRQTPQGNKTQGSQPPLNRQRIHAYSAVSINKERR